MSVTQLREYPVGVRAYASAKKPRRLKESRRRKIVDAVAAVMKKAWLNEETPTKLNHEATCRRGIRSALCLRGWIWADADAVASDVVSQALAQIGARRPSWQEGQPWYTEGGVRVIERTRCIRCQGQLTGQQTRYCSHECAAAHNMRIGHLMSLEGDAVYSAVARFAGSWSAPGAAGDPVDLGVGVSVQ